MRIDKIICSENIIRDMENGQVTIHNLYDEIKSNSYPILLNKFSIYFLAIKENQEQTITCFFNIENNDDILFQDSIKINFKDRNTSKGVIKFNGLSVPKDGILKVKFLNETQDQTIFEYNIYLTIKKIEPVVNVD